MKDLTCIELEHGQLGEYDQLVESAGTVFQGRSWLAAIGTGFKLVGFMNGGGGIVAVASVPVRRFLGQALIARAKLTPHCGPVGLSDRLSRAQGREAQRAIMSALVEYLEGIRPALCALNFAPGVVDCLPFRWKGYKVVPNYTYRLMLDKDREHILAEFSSVRKRNLRAAKRDGIEIRQIDDSELVLDLVEKSFARQGELAERQIIGRILRQYANPSNSYAFCAFREGQPIASVFIVHDQRTAYYLLGGYDQEIAHHGAGAACMFEAIALAREKRLAVFDFEGSVIPAIERYLRGFGGDLVPYYGVYKAWAPIECALKVRYRYWF